MKYFLIFLLLYFCLQSAQATHIVGGEFELTHISNTTYRLNLHLYFDKVHGDPLAIDPNITVSIFDKATNARKLDVRMSNPTSTPVVYTSIACTEDSLSTDRIVYSTLINLPENSFNNSSGYYVVWERCCRNRTISNIVSPEDAAQTFYLEFPPVTRNGVRFINSSPQLFPPLSDYACLNDLFYYDFGGKDPDGDSLVYEMVTPFNGNSTQRNAMPLPLSAPYSSLTWNSGLDVNNQIPGSPPVNINRLTGQLTVRPSALGLFVFGVKCSEYRANQKIGEVRRDFQLLVLDCPRNDKPSIKIRQAGKDIFYQEGDIIKVSADGNRCLDLFFTDTDPDEALTIEAKPINFTLPEQLISLHSGIVNRNGIKDTLTASACFPACLGSGAKVYVMDFIVADDGCSLPKKDTVRVSFQIDPVPNQKPSIAANLAGKTVEVLLGSTYTDTIYGLDPDMNLITLEARGDDFNLTDVDMQFTPVSGNGQAKALFTWTPACNLIPNKQQYKVHFKVTETACQPFPPEEINVVFNLTYSAPPEFIPANIFTPNHDGLNDTFEMPTLPPDFCASTFASIKIFNRWGGQVYESKDRNFAWNGKNVSDGVYFYHIRYTDKEFKGTVTLVR